VNSSILNTPEARDSLALFTRKLHESLPQVRNSIRQAIFTIHDLGTEREAAFELITKHREIRILGLLLQAEARQRTGLLTVEGSLRPEQAAEVLGLLPELEAEPRLIQGLVWAMPSWFVPPRQTQQQQPKSSPPILFVLHDAIDDKFARNLEEHLAPWAQTGSWVLWSPRDAAVGNAIADEIGRHLARARVIVILVSPELLANKFDLRLVELALERHRRGLSLVVPILTRPCQWESSLLGHLVRLPSNLRPVSMWGEKQGLAWEMIAEDLAKLAAGSLKEDGRSSLPRLALPREADAESTVGTRSSKDEEVLFSWLHVSDIHMRHGDASHRWDQRLVLHSLLQDAREHVSRGLLKPNALLVTGDIAFSGADQQADEYDAADTYLSDLAASIGLDRKSTFVVPGNHDVQWSADGDRNVKRLLRALRNGDEPLDEALTHADDRALLMRRQARYLAFSARFAPASIGPPRSPALRMFWCHRLTVPGGLVIRLIGLNTALLSATDDHGFLRVGKEQLASALLPPMERNEKLLVLSHHPLTGGWMADQRETIAWVRNHAHLHLSGHVHAADSESVRSGGGTDFLHISAGAAHGENLPPEIPSGHGYNFGAILRRGDGSYFVRLYPRRWSDKNKSFRPDYENLPDGRETAEHPLR